MKRIVALVILVILAVVGFFVFRSTRQVVADKDGNPIRYTYDEINEKELTGLFVHNEDNTFSPAIQSVPGFQGQTAIADPTRYLWYPETKDGSIEDYIPVVTGKTELVVIYNMDGEMPDSCYLERYGERGYTIGAHVRIEGDKTMYLCGKDALSSSQAKTELSTMSENTDDEYTISEISGSDALPINNVDPNMEVLLGLEQGKLYDFSYYRGTKQETSTFRADTKIFQSEKFITLTSPFKKTKNGYFIVNLPLNLADGYYYLSDIGFFRAKK